MTEDDEPIRLTKHDFVADTRGHADWHGRFSCLWCPLPKSNQIHDVQDRSEEQRDLESRRLGEGR